MLKPDKKCEHESDSSHCHADDVGNFRPIHPLDVAEQTGNSIEITMNFFEKEFGGYAAYVRQCENGEHLGKTLAGWAHDGLTETGEKP